MNAIKFLGLILAVSPIAFAAASGQRPGKSKPAEAESKKIERERALIRKVSTEQRVQIRALVNEEQAEIAKVTADKTKSASAKEVRIEGLRREYLEKRTEVRRKNSQYLRSELLRIKTGR